MLYPSPWLVQQRITSRFMVRSMHYGLQLTKTKLVRPHTVKSDVGFNLRIPTYVYCIYSLQFPTTNSGEGP